MELGLVTSGQALASVDALLPQLIDAKIGSRIAAQDPTIWGPAAEAESSIRLGWVNPFEAAGKLIPQILDLRDELPEGAVLHERLEPVRSARGIIGRQARGGCLVVERLGVDLRLLGHAASVARALTQSCVVGRDCEWKDSLQEAPHRGAHETDGVTGRSRRTP